MRAGVIARRLTLCWARRCVVRAWDCFCFGTPIWTQQASRTEAGARGPIELTWPVVGRQRGDDQVRGEERGDLRRPQWLTQRVTLRAEDPFASATPAVLRDSTPSATTPRRYAEPTNDRPQEVDRGRVAGEARNNVGSSLTTWK